MRSNRALPLRSAPETTGPARWTRRVVLAGAAGLGLGFAGSGASEQDPETGAVAQSPPGLFTELGGADPPLPGVPLPPEDALRYVGTYRLGAGADALLEVSEREGELRIARPPAAPRVLHALGDHTFFPAGAEAVRVRFEAEGDVVRAVTVHDPGLVARGVRLP